MVVSMNKLTVKKIHSLTKPGMHGDGNTLFLKIAPGGSKAWVQRLFINGKRRDLGLGGFPLVTLAEAREKAFDNRRAARRGDDPVADRKKVKVPMFREAAQATFDGKTFRSEKSARQWMLILENHAYPVLADLPVNRIEQAEVLAVLEPMWTAMPDTAKKLRQNVRAVLGWAEAHGFVDRNMAGECINGALPKLKFDRREHHRHVPYQSAGEAYAAIGDADAPVAARLCLQWVVLTAARSGEARGATWSEIDMAERVWTVPAERMKANEDHRVPLSDAAMAVLEKARALHDGSDMVFPSPVRRGKALSDNVLRTALQAAGLADRATVHGFRSTFRTWAEERTDAAHAVKELSIAHRVGSQVEQSYNHSDLLAKRRQLMRQWADYVIGGTGEKVVSFG